MGMGGHSPQQLPASALSPSATWWDVRASAPLVLCCLCHPPLLHANYGCKVVIRWRLAVYLKAEKEKYNIHSTKFVASHRWFNSFKDLVFFFLLNHFKGNGNLLVLIQKQQKQIYSISMYMKCGLLKTFEN